MKHYRLLLLIAAALVAASAALYGLHYAVFGDAHHIWIYLLGDIAFLPIDVLLVGLVLERMLSWHERRERLHKMNMVIGVFFSELGTRLLGDLAPAVENMDALRPHLALGAAWKGPDYRRAVETVVAAECAVRPDRLDLPALKALLSAQRPMLVMLLANPNLMEHERFTDLLWAVFHLMEELAARPSLDDLPPKDLEHLAGDVKRVFGQLAAEWLRYCRHLHQAYPYIHSIVVRTHPFQERPEARVK